MYFKNNTQLGTCTSSIYVNANLWFHNQMLGTNEKANWSLYQLTNSFKHAKRNYFSDREYEMHMCKIIGIKINDFSRSDALIIIHISIYFT